MSSESKDPQRVAGGLKASVHNPRVSEEAKESASRRFEEMGSGVDAPPRGGGPGAMTGDEGMAVPGAKYSSGRVDPSHSRDETLAQQEGQSRGRVSGQPGEQHVPGGYKATMKDPKVSQEAKQHAEQILRDNEAL